MKLALIGVGLIGGSFAKALRAGNKVDRIIGFDTDTTTLQRAAELGVIDEVATSAAEACEGADVVMIAVPVGSIEETFRQIAPRLSNTVIVTDVGSTKAGVVKAARRELGAAFPRFVPGHPIAGSERSGVEESHADLFDDALYVSTATEQTQQGARQQVEELWRGISCRIERMTPEEHDNVFAAVSHLPHLLAFALVAQIANGPDSERKFALAGAGFRDFTRLAASSPVVWRDICLANADAIGDQLSKYRDLLAQLEKAVHRGDAAALERVFTRSASTQRLRAPS